MQILMSALSLLLPSPPPLSESVPLLHAVSTMAAATATARPNFGAFMLPPWLRAGPACALLRISARY